MKRATLAFLIMVLAAPAFAQSDMARAGGAEFFGFKTYWADKREGCRPMISFKVKNVSSAEVGAIDIRMDVLDKDKNAVFAGGSAAVTATDLPPGQIREVAIGGDHEIAPRDCRGDMHQSPLSGIHFAVRLTAKVGADPTGVEILAEEPMKQDRIPAQN